MSNQIVVEFTVIDEVASDITRLANEVKKYAQVNRHMSKSAGSCATSTEQSISLIAEYAEALANVMEETALAIIDAKNTMKEADEALAQDYRVK